MYKKIQKNDIDKLTLPKEIKKEINKGKIVNSKVLKSDIIEIFFIALMKIFLDLKVQILKII